jgi:peptidoglycan/xylan/chitin deacetylase (PgdA/CDA1 family)
VIDWKRLHRRLAQRIWAEFLLRTGCIWWARRRLRQRASIVVLAFHRVLDDHSRRLSASLPGMIVRARTFEAMASYVAARYQAVDPLLARLDGDHGRLRFAFTFDDGWLDNSTVMLPLAMKHLIPVTIFVCTAACGEIAPFWPERVAARMRAENGGATWDRIETAIGRLQRAAPEDREREADLSRADGAIDRTLSWEHIESMRQSGVRFGAHTRSHASLSCLTSGEANLEIAGSKSDLERALGVPCEEFAYPYGDAGGEVRERVRSAGYRLAFTTRRGAWTARTDPCSIPRMCVWEGDLAGLSGRFSPAMFEYTLVWRAWRAPAAGH